MLVNAVLAETSQIFNILRDLLINGEVKYYLQNIKPRDSDNSTELSTTREDTSC
jgi:hypothetical protein